MKFIRFFEVARNYLLPDTAPLSAAERWRAALGALAGMLLVQAVLAVLPVAEDTRRLLAPAGATAAILFCLPHSPLGQPWSVAGGLLVSALTGYLCGQWITPLPLAIALAVAGSVWLMAALRCLHPPGGALAIVMLGAPQGKPEVLAAVLANVLALLFAAMLVNNLLKGRRYPFGRVHAPAKTPKFRLPRGGISDQDVDFAVKSIDSYLDITADDLVEVYRLATESAFRRHVGTRCGDIMNPEVVAVEFGTSLDDAWQQLRGHHVKALPVIDRSRRVIGLLTLDDFLRHVPDSNVPVAERLRQFMRPTAGVYSAKAEVVGQVMHEDVFTVSTEDDLAHVASRLALRGQVHAIPVLDRHQRLAGILSQTDLVAALYHQHALLRAQITAQPLPTA